MAVVVVVTLKGGGRRAEGMMAKERR